MTVDIIMEYEKRFFKTNLDQATREKIERELDKLKRQQKNKGVE